MLAAITYLRYGPNCSATITESSLRYVESFGDEAGLYSFAIVTRDPPQEVAATGHTRCVVALRAENLDAWLSPRAHTLGQLKAILDDPIEAYYQHELVDNNSP